MASLTPSFALRPSRTPAGLLLALVGLTGAAPAPAATIRVPADQPTLAAALAAAEPFDTVAAAPGTYFERVTLPSAVTLRADGAPGSVIVDGSGGGSVIVCVAPAEGAAIQGLVLRGGAGEPDGDTRVGGALLVRGGRLVLRDVRIEGSTADFGGGLFADGAEVVWAGGALVGNVGEFGGGWFAHAGRLRLEGVEIHDNQARVGGAGYGSSLSPFEAVSCDCHDNSALADAGGFYLAATGAALNDSRFVANSAGASGGALYLGPGTMATLSYVVLLDNRAATSGGGFHVVCDGAPGVRCAEARLFHTDLVANHAPGSGAASAAGTAGVIVEAGLIARNEGGIACLGPQAAVEIGCTALFSNGVTSAPGGCEPTYTDTLVVDPRLCDLASRDARRCANSPLLTPPSCGLPYVGALGGGCPACGPTPTLPTTWGSLKARYR